MDYRKLDGPLASVLGQQNRAALGKFPVFVRTQPQLTEEARNLLAASGITLGAEDATVFAGELSSDEVARLSDQPWVTSIHLSRKTRPLGM